MKVLVSAYACEPGKGSEPGNGWNWAASLAAHGHSVELLTRPDGRTAIEQMLGQFEGKIRPHYISDRLAPELPSGPLRTYGRYLGWQRRVVDYVRASKVDVQIAHHVSWGSLHTPTRLTSLNVPVVMGPLGGAQTTPPHLLQWYAGGRVSERARTVVTKSLMGRLGGADRFKDAAHIFATNQDTADFLADMKLSSKTSLLIADGIDPTLITSNRRAMPAKCKLLWVGRFMPRKAPMLAIDAFSHYLGHDPKAELVLVGGGPLLEASRRRVAELALEDKVSFTGQIPWADVMDHYDSASGFLFTSLRESFGAQCLEASARGLPMVVLDQHGPGQMLPDSAAVKVAHVGPEPLPMALAEGLRRLLESPIRWSQMSASAIAFARDNTWNSKVARAERVYHEVLRRR